MPQVTRRSSSTTTAAGLAGILATRRRRRSASSARSPTSAGTTSRPPRTRSWPRSASASPRTPASSSRSTTSRTWARSRRKYASEVQTQAGHDLVEMRMHFPWLYEPQLVDVSDVVAGLEKKYGKAIPSAYESGPRQGRLARGAAVPRHVRRHVPRGPLQEGQPQGARHVGGPLHRRQGAEEDGEPGRDPHRQNYDSISTAGPVLWSFGGMEVDKDGKTVRINSPATVQMIEWYKKMYKDCMEPEVLSWSDASNNESIQQGKAGWIHNPVSAYIVAKQRKLVTADGINHHRSLAGPNGRHETDTPRHIGIWKFSQERRAREGVDPVPARQEGDLRRVHHVGRRLQPAGVREAAGPPGAARPIRSTPPSRAKACSTTPTAGRRRPPTRSSSSPTRSSCPT